ncbi:uncharacterized protein BT62DRAFT_1034600 [Guyanagaster necrorhizus]|uniref:Uncharacterized protein n=1 Tax=Guyanagaster necrorhizus TaxID=856835 RepID=A0A9P7VMA6_9AGAR|nr:uncharacterized protein BT62DRAFT_1034600 [Guyanagaster necrorhizus MCA 3950]KAG7443222.1 hypothetical protein BT62DRAFT_1034600 [Guyanagaster necrorhizus MCA 3950]
MAVVVLHDRQAHGSMITIHTYIRKLKDRGARIFFWSLATSWEAFQVAPDALKEFLCTAKFPIVNEVRCHARVIKFAQKIPLFFRICVVADPDAALVPAVSGKKTYGTSQEEGRDGIGKISVYAYDSKKDSPSRRRHDVARTASFFRKRLSAIPVTANQVTAWWTRAEPEPPPGGSSSN